jgi:hypothetical protein
MRSHPFVLITPYCQNQFMKVWMTQIHTELNLVEKSEGKKIERLIKDWEVKIEIKEIREDPFSKPSSPIFFPMRSHSFVFITTYPRNQLMKIWMAQIHTRLNLAECYKRGVGPPLYWQHIFLTL